MALCLIGASGSASYAQEPESPPFPSPWERIFGLRFGAGYNDNVSLAHASPQHAPFLYTGLDAVVSRLPVDGNQLNFTLTAENSAFLGSGPVDHETLVFFQAEATQEFATGWRPSLGLDYFYQYQVIDVSTTETNQEALLARGQTFTVRPGVRLDLNPRWWIAVEAPVDYQWFAEPLDDFWEAGARATLGRLYGHKSEVTISYGALHRSYENDPALSADGEPIPGVTKAFWQQEARLAWRHYWDSERRWRSTAKLAFKANRDDASGYFDFNRYSAAGQIRYAAAKWEITAGAGVYYYDYAVQTAGGPGSPNRQRTEGSATLRAERQIAKAWRVFAEYEYERIWSNIPIEEYSVNAGKAGVSWEF
jgi:hypothetical protein